MQLALVAHVFGFNDGQARVNYEIARAAVDAGVQLTLIAEKCADDLLASDNVRFIRIGKSSLPLQLAKNLSFAVRSARWLRSHRAEFDVIQANGFITFEKADIVAAHFVHGAWLRSPYSRPQRSLRDLRARYQRVYTRINAGLEQLALRKARTLVAVSKNVGEEMRSVGVPEEKIAVIFNGVDVDEFQPRPQDRARFGLPESVPLFLFCGDIRTRRKNLDGVLHALKNMNGVHLAVAGSAAGSPFPGMAKELGLEERVHFLGHVSAMSALMASADAFVFPSRYDPLGLVVLEAMATGLPVITAKTTGAYSVLNDPEWTLDDPEDTARLARMMQALAADAVLRQQVGSRNREKALAHTWRKMAAEYLALYERTAEGRKLVPA